MNNLPGKDFTALFLKRHRELSIRTANLIKRSRAGLSHEIINSFFDNYEKSAAGIEPCNIYNYDETNLRDNPGAQKAIFRRGVKYAEQVVMANLFLRLSSSFACRSAKLVGIRKNETVFPHTV